MTNPYADATRHNLNLPSLLATTSARQAMTPTARMQARLNGARETFPTERSEFNPIAIGADRESAINSSSFNHLACKFLSEQNVFESEF